MSARISVTVKGPLGIDEPDLMLAELERQTGVVWRPQPVDEGKVLNGSIAEIVMVAVLTKATEVTVQAALDRAKQLVGRWRSERLDPLEMTVSEEPAPDGEAPGGPASTGSDH
ncbi:hypothetical protein [Streptomyces odontomachi]|uniref:hypothetical protein n=1 Tax=Streptomyces odontomachi TaxID=2944940 RepID=UPI00210E0BC1|nr:hypothetical protein [Streptomyces sp. ODS25]